MSAESEEDLAAFVALHGAALRASRVPECYWQSLSRKLRGEVGARAPLAGEGAAGSRFGGGTERGSGGGTERGSGGL